MDSIKVSRGNFDEKIYSVNNLPAQQPREINRAEYEHPDKLTPYFKSHPAYFSDFMAFQHLELWMHGLKLNKDNFVFDDSEIPLVFSCRIAGNYQKFIGPINFYLGNIAYHLSDFKTKEEVSSSEILINNRDLLPRIFNNENNWGFQKRLFLSMQDNFLEKNLFEIKIEDDDKGLSGRLLFKTSPDKNFENGYAETLNSGDKRVPLREIMTKRWVELIERESVLKYKGQTIDFSKLETTCFIDESSGFPLKKKTWDWMIFNSNSESEDIRLIMGKKCKRAGYPVSEKEVATLFVDGKIYRLKGDISFNYDVNNLKSPWKVSFYDKKNSIEVRTGYIAPLVEESSVREKKGPIEVTLDLQRIIADTNVSIILDSREINVNGIGSFESNKGITRGTRYFKD